MTSVSKDAASSRSRPVAGILGALVLLFAVALAARFALGSRGSSPAAPYELWLYQAVNLADDPSVDRLEPIWRRAAAAGYRHVVLADHKFARLGEMDAHYFENVRRVKRLAADLGLEIVPGVFQLGRSGSLLAHDPNLAEGLPVRGALFEVRGGVARIVADPPVRLPPRPDRHDGGVAVHDGIVTVRDNPRLARFRMRTRLHPYRCYHVSVEVRTRDYDGTPLVQAVARGKPIHFVRSIGVRPTQDWTTHHVAFNSLDHSSLDLYFGVWRAAHGTLEWRNWRIEEVGPFNVLRRAGAPCVIEGAVEGRDLEPIRDPRLGRTPWRGEFDAWHEPPTLHAHLTDGTRFRMSWTHAAVVFENQVMGCLSEPALFDRLGDEARRVADAWGARAHLMMIDEIRAMNQDESCRRRRESPGTILAEASRRCVGLLKGSRVYVWSDMYDPFQNATRGQYLVRGNLGRSWMGLPPEVVVVNWNSARPGPSLRFFASRGHRQILAGYYDGRPEDMRGWLRTARGVKGVVGVMYTTWKGNFTDLEEFARVCREGR